MTKYVFVLCSFLEILSRFSDFVNSDDCIRKNHIQIYQTTTSFYEKKNLKYIKNKFYSSEKLKNSGNFIYEYAYSLFGQDFNPMRFTGNKYKKSIC